MVEGFHFFYKAVSYSFVMLNQMVSTKQQIYITIMLERRKIIPLEKLPILNNSIIQTASACRKETR